MADRPGMTDAEWRLLLAIAHRGAARQPGSNGETDAALAAAQAERDAATKPTRLEKIFPGIENALGHETPPPQPEGASRRERLILTIHRVIHINSSGARQLADAILADLAAPLSEAEAERISEAIAAELGKGPDAQPKPEPSPDAELGRMVRKLVDEGLGAVVLDRTAGGTEFTVLSSEGFTDAATLDEAVADLVAKLGDDGHG